jgi:N-methylhydantoinase B/oxoprolinase/acetone carboxylase alpha subunit
MSRVTALFRRVLAGALRNGVPIVALSAVAVVALIAIVVTADKQTATGVTAYAEFSVTKKGCAIEPTRSFNVTSCAVLGNGTYQLTFLRSLKDSTPIASLAACCPGRITASVSGDRTITVFFGRLKRSEVRASVVLP